MTVTRTPNLTRLSTDLYHIRMVRDLGLYPLDFSDSDSDSGESFYISTVDLEDFSDIDENDPAPEKVMEIANFLALWSNERNPPRQPTQVIIPVETEEPQQDITEVEESQEPAVCLALWYDPTPRHQPVRVVNDDEESPQRDLSPYDNVPIVDEMQVNFDTTFSNITTMNRPRRIGYFSLGVNPVNGSEIYTADKSQLRYLALKLKTNKLDLVQGFDNKTIWSRCPNDPNHVLKWYTQNRCDFTLDENLKGLVPEFITDIRTLTSIMTSPFDKRNDWDIMAAKVGSKIIMYEVDTTARKNFVGRQSEFNNRSSYAGYKFESLVTRRYNGEKCHAYYGGLRNSFHSVLITQVGQHNVLYNARCSAVANKRQMDLNINDMEFVEIKTRSKTRNRAFHSRLPGLWARAILNNVIQTVIGPRDDDFILNLKDCHPKYITDKMPSRRNSWSPRTMCETLEATMDFIKAQIVEPNVVYRFNHSPGNSIICQRVDEEPLNRFIPQWYLDNHD